MSISEGICKGMVLQTRARCENPAKPHLHLGVRYDGYCGHHIAQCDGYPNKRKKYTYLVSALNASMRKDKIRKVEIQVGRQMDMQKKINSLASISNETKLNIFRMYKIFDDMYEEYSNKMDESAVIFYKCLECIQACIQNYSSDAFKVLLFYKEFTAVKKHLHEEDKEFYDHFFQTYVQ